MERLPGRPRFRELSRVPSRDCEILAVEVPSAPHVWVPAWIFVPKQPVKRLLIIAEPRGRNSAWAEGALFQRLAAGGTVVCAPDLRGIGDLKPEYSPGAPSYTGEHEDEENYAWASLMLGRSLLGQRVTDLLAVIEALSAEKWGKAFTRSAWTVDHSCSVRGVARAHDRRRLSCRASDELAQPG